MPALKSGQVRTAVPGEPGAGVSLFGGRFVLPRWLRRPARLLTRMCSGDYQAPRFAASILIAGLIGSSVVYGAWLGGQIPTFVQALSARTGFAVDEVKVSGHHETSEIDILEKLELDGWTSLVGFDASEARDRIASLPWVKSAAVRKVYPGTIEVRIEEREAFAVWQHGSQLALVERDGDVILPYSGSRYVHLPLVVGFGAQTKAAPLIDKIRQFPELASRVKGYIHVAERRWDLRLENGVTVKLPESGEDEAIAGLVAMDREQGLLSRDVAAIDMRLNDRLVVQLTPDAVVRRTTMIEDAKKAAKKRAGKKI